MRKGCSRGESRKAALISTRLQPGVAGSGRGRTVSTVWSAGGKLFKQFPSARGADTRLKPGANERGDGEGDAPRTAPTFSPSPRPSPAGRGRDASRRRPTGTPEQFDGWLTFSLSQRERAGARENASFAHPCRPFTTAVFHSLFPEPSEENPKIRGGQRWAFESLSAPNLWVPRLLPRATGTVLPSLSFHAHQPPTHRRTP